MQLVTNVDDERSTFRGRHDPFAVGVQDLERLDVAVLGEDRVQLVVLVRADPDLFQVDVAVLRRVAQQPERRPGVPRLCVKVAFVQVERERKQRQESFPESHDLVEAPFDRRPELGQVFRRRPQVPAGPFAFFHDLRIVANVERLVNVSSRSGVDVFTLEGWGRIRASGKEEESGTTLGQAYERSP